MTKEPQRDSGAQSRKRAGNKVSNHPICAVCERWFGRIEPRQAAAGAFDERASRGATLDRLLGRSVVPSNSSKLPRESAVLRMTVRWSSSRRLSFEVPAAVMYLPSSSSTEPSQPWEVALQRTRNRGVMGATIAGFGPWPPWALESPVGTRDVAVEQSVCPNVAGARPAHGCKGRGRGCVRNRVRYRGARQSLGTKGATALRRRNFHREAARSPHERHRGHSRETSHPIVLAP